MNCLDVPEIGRNGGKKGLSSDTVSCHEWAEMRGGEGLPGDIASCKEMAEIEEEMRLPLAARK